MSAVVIIRVNYYSNFATPSSVLTILVATFIPRAVTSFGNTDRVACGETKHYQEANTYFKNSSHFVGFSCSLLMVKQNLCHKSMTNKLQCK